ALPASAPLLVPSLCRIRIPGVSPRIAPPLLSSSSRPPALSAGCSASHGGATSEYQTGPFLCSEINQPAIVVLGLAELVLEVFLRGDIAGGGEHAAQLAVLTAEGGGVVGDHRLLP